MKNERTRIRTNFCTNLFGMQKKVVLRESDPWELFVREHLENSESPALKMFGARNGVEQQLKDRSNF